MINDKLVKYVTDLIDARKQKILWKNEEPTEPISGGEQAKFTSSDYDYIIWIYCYNTNTANTGIQKSSICLKRESVMMNVVGYTTGTAMRRVADYENDTTYTFRDAYNGSSVGNTYCIPLFAIGGKL